MKYTRFLLMTLALMLCTATLAVAGSEAPYNIQVVRQTAILIDGAGLPIGTAEYWNTRLNFIVELQLDGNWHVGDTQLYAGSEPPLFEPVCKKDKPVPGQFPCKREFNPDRSNTMVQCSLKDELAQTWGGDQTRYVALHGELGRVDSNGDFIEENSFWMNPATTTDEGEMVLDSNYAYWPRSKYGGYYTTKFYHPQRGQFIDAPVKGLNYETPTHVGNTQGTEEDGTGGFDFFPGETIKFSIGSVPLGSARAGKKVSPLDLFQGSDTDDPRVIGVARILQSLDADSGADQSDGKIVLLPEVVGCFEGIAGTTDIDFGR